MSRSFTSRPTQTRTRGGQTSQTNLGRGETRDRGRQEGAIIGGRPLNNHLGSGIGRSVQLGERNTTREPSVKRGLPRKMQGQRDPSEGRPSQAAHSDEQGEPQRAQHMGAFTVFAPNEKRREQIQKQAQKETAAFDQFKKQNAEKVYHHVGTVGGGEISENQVRNRQANTVKAQRIIRQTKQEELKAATRRSEAEQIDQKRAEQRRKVPPKSKSINSHHYQRQAEQNKIREGIAPQARELRRKREAFLQQFQANETPPTAFQDQTPTHQPKDDSKKPSSFSVSTSVTTKPTRPVATTQSTRPVATTQSTRPVATTQSTRHVATTQSTRPVATTQSTRPVATTQSTRPVATTQSTRPVATTQSPRPVATTQSTRPVATTTAESPTHPNYPPSPMEANGGPGRVCPPDENDTLSMLCAMFPNVDQGTLSDLIVETGSIEAVVSILGMD